MSRLFKSKKSVSSANIGEEERPAEDAGTKKPVSRTVRAMQSLGLMRGHKREEPSMDFQCRGIEEVFEEREVKNPIEHPSENDNGSWVTTTAASQASPASRSSKREWGDVIRSPPATYQPDPWHVQHNGVLSRVSLTENPARNNYVHQPQTNQHAGPELSSYDPAYSSVMNPDFGMTRVPTPEAEEDGAATFTRLLSEAFEAAGASPSDTRSEATTSDESFDSPLLSQAQPLAANPSSGVIASVANEISTVESPVVDNNTSAYEESTAFDSVAENNQLPVESQVQDNINQDDPTPAPVQMQQDEAIIPESKCELCVLVQNLCVRCGGKSYIRHFLCGSPTCNKAPSEAPSEMVVCRICQENVDLLRDVYNIADQHEGAHRPSSSGQQGQETNRNMLTSQSNAENVEEAAGPTGYISRDITDDADDEYHKHPSQMSREEKSKVSMGLSKPPSGLPQIVEEDEEDDMPIRRVLKKGAFRSEDNIAARRRSAMLQAQILDEAFAAYSNDDELRLHSSPRDDREAPRSHSSQYLQPPMMPAALDVGGPRPSSQGATTGGPSTRIPFSSSKGSRSLNSEAYKRIEQERYLESVRDFAREREERQQLAQQQAEAENMAHTHEHQEEERELPLFSAYDWLKGLVRRRRRRHQ